MLTMFSSVFVFFFFNDTATTEIYTLSLHDTLPICEEGVTVFLTTQYLEEADVLAFSSSVVPSATILPDRKSTRLNSSHVEISYAVFCLKKKKKKKKKQHII